MTLSNYTTKITKKFFPSLITLSLLLGFSLPAKALASTYGSSTYSNCVYSNGCPPAAAAHSPASSPSSPSKPASSTLLNDYDLYFADSGVQLTLSKNQVIYFDVTAMGQTVRHKITITNISTGSSYIDIVIDTNIHDRLYTGDTRQYDVNGDGQKDIEITLNGVSATGKADITFRALTPVATTVPLATSVPTSTPKHNYWLPIVSLASLLLGVLIIIIVAARRRRRRREDSLFTTTGISQYKSPY